MELNQLTAHELLDKLKSGAVTPVAIRDSLYARIQKVDSKVNAYVRAGSVKKSDPKVIPQGQLNGLPITIKDNICTEGLNTECCSKILQGFCLFRET